MKLVLVTVRADGTVGEQQIDPRDCLPQLQDAVGGYLEVVPYLKLFDHGGATHSCVAFCDEEGKLKGKPVNRQASDIWDRQLAEKGVRRNIDVLVGDIAFVFGDPALMKLL